MTSGQENAPSWQAIVRDGRNWVWKNAMVGGVPVSSPSFKLLLHFYMLKWPSLPFTSLLYRLVFKEVYREEKLLRHVPMVTKFRNFVQRRLRNVRKSMMHMQSCCFVNINLLLFNCSWCGCRRCCLSSLLLWYRNFATMVTWHHTSPFYRRVVLNSSPLPFPHPQYYRPLFSHRQFTFSSVWIQDSSHIKLVINLDILFFDRLFGCVSGRGKFKWQSISESV